MNKNGFIFIYVLLLSFLILSIGTYVFNRGIILPPFVKVTGDDQKIRELAFGVVQRCIAQLAMPKKENTEKPKENEGKKPEISRDFDAFFPAINRWQNYTLKEEIDGVDANVSICFVCEEGKININHLFDFKEKRLKKEPLIDELSKFLETFQIKGFKEQLEQFFKKHEAPLDDITELCIDEYFEKSFGNRLFYVPSDTGKAVEKKEIYLADLFTIYNPDGTVNPFFLSDSVTQLFEFRRAIAQPIDERKKHAESLRANLKETFSWAEDWKKFLEPMYQKPVGRYEQFFKKNLKCNLFSAVCRVQVGNRSETIFVIFSRKERAQDDKIMYDVAIMRLYFV